MSDDLYSGPVVFREGVHYPVAADGTADLSRPLRWVAGSSYRDAADGETLHNDAHHQQFASIEIGGDEPPVIVTPDELARVSALLTEIRKGDA